MIKASTKVTEKGFDEWKKVEKEIKRLDRSYVEIGVHEDAGQYQNGETVLQVALWNEFGTETIPERSFFRSAIDENVEAINKTRERLMNDIMDGKVTVQDALEQVGIKIQFLIQNKIKSNIGPEYGSGKGPNDAKTIAAAQAAKQAKGMAPVTLIATGLMLRSITYRVVVVD